MVNRGGPSVPSSQNGLKLVTHQDLGANSLSSLSIAILSVFLYCMIGVIYYTGYEGYSFIDSVYFSCITLMTIGYGDLHPKTEGERQFTIFFCILGAGIVGSLVALMSSDLMDTHEAVMKSKMMQLSKQMSGYVKGLYSGVKDTSIGGALISSGQSGTDFLGKKFSKTGIIANDGATVKAMMDMNTALFDETLTEIRNACLANALTIAFFLFFGGLFMMWIEDWNFVDAVYWSSATITSVGYGDITPLSDGGKVFTIFFALIGCSFSVKAFGEVTRFPLVVRSRLAELKVTAQFGDEISEETLRSLIGNEFFDDKPNLQRNKSELSKSEFVLLLLRMMNKINEKDVILVSRVFDEMDHDKSGVLDKDEIDDQAVKAAEKAKERIQEHERVATQEADSLAGQVTQHISTFGGLLLGTGVAVVSNITAPLHIFNREGSQQRGILESDFNDQHNPIQSAIQLPPTVAASKDEERAAKLPPHIPLSSDYAKNVKSEIEEDDYENEL